MSTVAEPATPKRTHGQDDDDVDVKRQRLQQDLFDLESYITRADISTSYNYDETISILVGPEKAKFTAHKDVLSARSQYFNTACSERWLEGQQKTVPLPEHERETFQMYMDLIYNRLVYDTGELAVMDSMDDKVR